MHDLPAVSTLLELPTSSTLPDIPIASTLPDQPTPSVLPPMPVTLAPPDSVLDPSLSEAVQGPSMPALFQSEAPKPFPVVVDESVPPSQAFPFEHHNDADESYHTGSCLVPRKLSEAEYAEWQAGIKDREEHWGADNFAKLKSLVTVGDVPQVIKDELGDLLGEFSSIFGRDLNDIRTGLVRFMAHLEVKDPNKVMYSAPRNHNLLLSEATSRYTRILMDAKICEPSFSAHAANSFCVPTQCHRRTQLSTCVLSIWIPTSVLHGGILPLGQHCSLSSRTRRVWAGPSALSGPMSMCPLLSSGRLGESNHRRPTA